MFGRPGSAAAGAEGEEEDPVEQQISEELLRYQALFTHPDELDPSEVLTYWAKKGKHAF
ncbi:unnamed protein product, partial [Ascophyllum nodosum]